MRPTKVYASRAENERAFVELYDYALSLEDRVAELTENWSIALQKLQELNMKVQELEAEGKPVKNKK